MVADLFNGRNFVEFGAIEALLGCDRSFVYSLKAELERVLTERSGSDGCDLTSFLDANPPGFCVEWFSRGRRSFWIGCNASGL